MRRIASNFYIKLSRKYYLSLYYLFKTKNLTKGKQKVVYVNIEGVYLPGFRYAHKVGKIYPRRVSCKSCILVILTFLCTRGIHCRNL